MKKLLLSNKLISSLELVEQINIFRQKEGRSSIRHDTLLSVIRDEFEEEIGVQIILETPYVHPQNKQTYYMYELTSDQAKQVLVRESKFVRKAVISYINKLEQHIRAENIGDPQLYKFLDIAVQKDFSKKINAKNFEEGGVTKTVKYNYDNCLYHTGKTPAQIKEIGKEFGLKSVERTSAKEVIRNLKPQVACSMSFTDSLVSSNVEYQVAAKTAKELATPLFEQLLRIGLSYEEVEKLAK